MFTTGYLLASVSWVFNLLRFVFYLLGIACMVKFLTRR